MNEKRIHLSPPAIPTQTRYSQRSYATSSSDSESRIICKDFCKMCFGIMCTQVGVGSILVSYAMVGSAAFMYIEGRPELNVYNRSSEFHEKAAKKLWRYTVHWNNLYKEQWYINANSTLYELQNEIVQLVRDNIHDSRPVEQIWTFPASLMFSLSIFTMIGYGYMTPKTDWGKVATISYGVFGIPLYVLFFVNCGKLFAKTLKFLYISFHRCIKKSDFETEIITVPSTACVWVLMLYILLGTVMYANREQWSYLDACYFTFTSLAKIGHGDFIPGIKETDSTKDKHVKLIITSVYILVGMALIAMCYVLMKEKITLKITSMTRDFRERMYDFGARIGFYSQDRQSATQRVYRPNVQRRIRPM